MRDTATLQPLGTTLLRKMFLIVTTLVVTIFAYLAFTAPVSAETNYDATWAQGSLTYKGNTYTGPTAPIEGHDIPDGSHLYSYFENSGNKWHVIYFPPDTDFSTVKEGTYVTYNRVNGIPSDKSSPQTITIDPSTSAEANRPTDEASTSCKIDGVGWFVCSGTNFLASGMDWVFHTLAGFVEVRPLATESNSVMHRVWDIMRSFANVAFVIAFIIIIYSQLTSFGVSNYGIKKLLPRLILAAIFVNISYWICVVAIDISNILGDSLQRVFMNLRDMVLGEGGGNGWQLVSWEAVASFILSGGAAAGAAASGLFLASTTLGAFSVGGVALLLVPILLGAFMTVLVVLFILAARQAIITLLVIIAPLAMVAFLLPNTEKWFEKWRSLFMTMLIFFPAFSLVFGAAQFAGLMIIQNADDINTILLGMAVQIAPLAITPLLLKLSGSLLSKVAGIINDPSRGLKDRAKNWSRERLDQNRVNNLAKTREMAKAGTLKRRHAVRRVAMNADTRKRVREGQKSVSESASDNYFNDSKAGHVLDDAKREVEREKNRVHSVHESHWNIKAKIDPESLEKELEVRISADEANLSKLKLDSVYEEIKAGNREHAADILGVAAGGGPVPNDARAARRIDMLNKASDTTSYLAVEGMRKAAAEQEQKNNLSKQLELNRDLVDGHKIRNYAGGIQGEAGAQRALASAYSTSLAAYEDNIKNANAIIGHGNPEDADVTRLITTKIGEVDAKTGIKVTEDIRIAAIRKIAGGKNADELVNMLRHADIPKMSQDERQEMGEALLANGATPKWLGAGAKAAIKQGNVSANGNERINEWIVSTIRDNKLSSAETLVNQDKTFIAEVTNTLRDPSARARINPEQLRKLKQEMHQTLLHDSRYSGRIGERDSYFEDLYNEIGSSIPGGPATYADAKTTAP